jgi:hypothetical protein
MRRRRNAPVGTARTRSISPTPPAFQKMRAKLIARRSMERRNGPRCEMT